MKADYELEAWREQWRGETDVPAELMRKVEQGTIEMKRGRIAEVMVTVVIGGGTIVFAALTRDLPSLLLVSGTWVFIAFCWAFSVRASRGLWTATEESTAAYIDLSIERCRRGLEELRTYYVTSVLLTVFVVAVDYQILAARGALNTTRDYVELVAAGVLALGIVLGARTGKKQKLRNELEGLIRMQRQLENGPAMDRMA